MFDAERRLLYVAVTRARDHLYVIEDHTRPSPFLAALRSANNEPQGWRRASWDKYPAALSPQPGRVVVEGAGTYEVRDLLKKSGFKWNPRGRYWHAIYPAGTDVTGRLRRESWGGTNSGLTVTIQGDGQTEHFWVARGVWSPLSPPQ